MVDRISTFGHSATLTKDLMRLQSNYASYEKQSSSGLKSDNYQGIASNTQKLLNMESDYRSLSSQTENAQTSLDRVNAQYNTIQSISDLLSTFRSNLSAAMSGSTDNSSFTNLATNTQQEMASLLNTQLAGRYLFAGSATDTAPVNLTDAAYSAATTPSTADTNYYQGDDFISSVQASDTLNVSYGITANNSAFEQAFRALNLVINNPSDSATLNEAYTLLTSAITDTSVLATNNSNAATSLDSQIDQNMEHLNLIDDLVSDIKNVDLASVTVKLSELETQLETSYSLATKLLQLNLADYLS